jgi:hypothetical protein
LQAPANAAADCDARRKQRDERQKPHQKQASKHLNFLLRGFHRHPLILQPNSTVGKAIATVSR